MTDRVECHSGFHYAERPQAIHWEGQRLKVVEIKTEWRTPLSRCFRVRTQDERWFVLSYNEMTDEWTIQPT